MPERSTLKPAPTSSVPSLVPQGEQAGKPAMPLGRPFTLIGSRNRAHLHLLSSSISRNHACIIATDTGLYVRDLASRTGVVVNGRKVKDADLHDGDKVEIGSFKFRFADPAGNLRLGITPKPVAAMLEMDATTLTPVDVRTILIGRRPICDIALPEARVSNTHALIFEINGQRYIRDLGSRTGTLVNGKPIHHQELEFGDHIQIGDTEFRYVSAVAPLEQTADLAPEELSHVEEEEPIGLAFDDRHPSDRSELESIPEANEHDLLAVEPAEESEPAEHVEEAQPVELAPAEPVASNDPQDVSPSEISEPEGHEESIDFEIAGSQLDLQKKVMETSRLAAEPEEPPAHAVTASEELLQPVGDVGLDFWEHEQPRDSIAEEPPAAAAPVEQVAESEPVAPGPPAEDLAHEERTLAPQELPAEPVDHHLTILPDVVADLEEPPAAPAEMPAELPVVQDESAPTEPEPEHLLTTDDSVFIEPPPAIEEEPIATEEAAPLAPPEAPEIEAESAPVAHEPLAAETPALEPPPVPIDQVDLSVVDFGAERSATSSEFAAQEIEPQPEPPSEPAPLLNLDAELAPPPETPAIAAETVESAETESGKRKPRRKRTRKKKGAAAPSEAPEVAAPIGEDENRDAPIPDTTSQLIASEADVAEVIEPTIPTPDSAQDLGEAIEAVEPSVSTLTPTTAVGDALTDTAFAQVVQDFTGPQSGPIVEESVAADAQATVPDEGVMSVEPPIIPEPEPVVTDSPATDSTAITEEPAPQSAFTTDPSLDEVIELDSSALLDDVEDAAVREEPQPFETPQELAENAGYGLNDAPPLDDATIDERLAEPPSSPTAEPTEPSDAEVATETPAAAQERSAAPRKPVDPFFGMERDLGSFIGGIPLSLTPAPAPEKPPALEVPRTESPPVPVPQSTTPLDDEFPSLPEERSSLSEESGPSEPALSAHVAPPATDEPAGLDDLPDLDALDVEEKLTFSEPEPIPPLDALLAEDQEPLELFEGTAEKLDELPGLEPIEDIGGALAEKKEPAPPPPAVSPTVTPIKHSDSPFAGAPLAGAPAKPKVTPPPPPKTSPLRSFTHALSDVPDSDTATGAGVPPFAGAKPANRGRVSSFEGLAMPPVREADVFSHDAFSGLGDVFFGAAPAGDVPPIPPTNRSAGPAAAPKSPAPASSPAAQSPPPGTTPKKQRDRKREAIPPNRQALRGTQPGSGRPPVQSPARPLAQPPAPPPDAEQAKRVPWWKRVRTLLPIMLLCLVGAWAGIYYALPPRHIIEGTLRFQGLDSVADTQQNLPDAQQQITQLRKERADGIRKILRQPDLRMAAADAARNSGAPGGFLDSPAILEQLSEPSTQADVAHSEFDVQRGTLRLFYPTKEPALDRTRIKAVLAQLYAADGLQRDRAATARRTLDGATSRVNELEQQRGAEDLLLKRLSNDVTATGAAAAPDVLEGKVSVQTLEEQDQQLRSAWQKAIVTLAQRKADLEKAQTAPPTASGTEAQPQPDPQLASMKASLDSLNQQLQAAQSPGGGAEQAARAFETAFARLDDQLASISPPADNDAVAAYLEAARAARDEIRQILQRTRTDAQALQQLRGRVSDQADTNAAADGPLHDLLEERNAHAHRYEAAAGSGLAEEALKIRGVLDDLDQKIEARRQVLKASGTAPQPAQESIAQLERDRQRDPQRIQERLKRIQQAAPPPQAIPAQAREAVAELGRRVSAALGAADRYAAAAATPIDAGEAVASLRSKIAVLQSQIDRRRKELADAAAAELDQQQRQQRQAAVTAAQKAVTAAMEAESSAATAYTSNRKLLSAARDLAEEKGRAAELMQKLQVAREELDQQKKSAAATAVVLPPDDNSVSITYGQDRRVTYLVVVSAVIVLFFGILMWAVSAQPAEAHVPFASAVAVAHDVPGHHPEEFDSDLMEDDPHRAMIA